MPLPDSEGRAGLLELFSRGLQVNLTDPDAVIEATDQVSPAYLRELVRKAALHAAAAGDSVVDDRHFASALTMLEEGGQLMKSLLGGGGDEAISRAGPEGGAGWVNDDLEWDE
jgi:ATP-dependent 26S proteasome regulatory subunit